MASALVQMTAFSPCSQLGDLIMIGMEASLESFPGSREEGNKRPHSDGDEEQDRSHVKKRRKQSKPIRITAVDSACEDKGELRENGKHVNELDFSETGEHFLSEGAVLVGVTPLPDKEEYDGTRQNIPLESNKASSVNQEDKAQHEMFDSLLPLNLSNIKPPFMDSLIVPNSSESQNNPNKHVPIGNSQSQFQQHQEVSKTSTAQENSYFSPTSSLLLPMFKQSQIQSQISQMNSQMRIFNPEAFCDLCNKEFCNKYFLKTHKANKHGIYTENMSGPTLLDPMPSLPFTNYFSTSTESYESTQNFQATNISKNIFNHTNYSAIRTVPKKSPAPQHPQQPPQSGLFSMKSNGSSSTSGNMKALCNICNKKFCNKYFVRRHKLKIHGILEPPDTTNQENNNFSNTSQEKFELSSGEAELYSGFPKPYLPSNFNIDIKDVTQNLETNVEKSKDKSENESENDIQTSLGPYISTTVENNTLSLFKISQNEENNKENSLSSNKLKKLGVVNADAFCEICCKEYCNKYFLRTHKLKSHGILPVEEKKEDTVNGTSNMAWFHSQNTPLNLIVNEASTNRDATEQNCFDKEGEDCMCSICGRYFQDKFLLKMHQEYTHPNKFVPNEMLSLTNQNTKLTEVTKSNKDVNEQDKPNQPLESYLPSVKSEFIPELDESEPKLNVNSENLQKLQKLIHRINNPHSGENSICDMCDKDFGDISLLENHIIKEHTHLLEEVGNVSEEENSNSQSSLMISSFSVKKECPQCQKIFFNSSQFVQHISECQGDLNISADLEIPKGSIDLKETNNTLKMSQTQFNVPPSEERQGLQTPTSSFCEICKKELCNKYFMKTHMQRMHGISIENGAQIGGVVCDICNKELCSKYFLRVHKQNSHGIIDEMFLPQLGLDFGRNQSPNPNTADPALKPNDQNDLTHRYFTHFSEVCTICNRRFKSAKWLKAHLWNDHGEEGKERWKDVCSSSNSEFKANQFEETLKEIGKPLEFQAVFGNTNQLSLLNTNENSPNGKDFTEKQGLDKNILNNTIFSMLMNGKDTETKHYQCSYCSFSTSILAFLFIHERSHMNTRTFQVEPEQSLQCPICFQSLESKHQFEKHIKLHKMPFQQQPTTTGNVDQGTKSQFKDDFITSASKEQGSQHDKEASDNVVNSSQQYDKASQPQQSVDSSFHCTRCGFRASNIQVYLDHVSKEHPYPQMEQELPAYLQQVEQTLSTLAGNSGIPAIFAAPCSRTQHQVTMQPFVLEDSEYLNDMSNSVDPKPGKTFLSSLVFLPVKEKLKTSVTASFKLTPT